MQDVTLTSVVAGDGTTRWRFVVGFDSGESVGSPTIRVPPPGHPSLQ
jgi:hypothetical protein